MGGCFFVTAAVAAAAVVVVVREFSLPFGKLPRKCTGGGVEVMILGELCVETTVFRGDGC